MRVAVIDCGTNTVRLLVADDGPDGTLAEVDRRLELVRLGEGVDATRTFAPQALARTFSALDGFAARIAELGCDRVRFLATSASRDVTNRDEFEQGVRERLGVGVDVIAGQEEARLAFLGALSGGPVAEGPVLVMDVGGGSTEFVLGNLDGTVSQSVSLNMGSVRIRERFLASDPPAAGEIAAARAFADDLLDGSGIDFARARTWIGVAGTTTSLSAIVHGLHEAYDRALVHDSTVEVTELTELSEGLFAMPVEDVLATWPMLQRLRAEVICAGALICEQTARRVGQPLRVRETDILDGATLELLRRR